MTSIAAIAAPQGAVSEPVDLFDMFDLAPVALSLEDYSQLHVLFEQWRRDGVVELRAWLEADAARVTAALARVRLIRVNRRTLELFGADSTDHMIANMQVILRDALHQRHVDELVELWHGNERYTSQAVNHSIAGARLDVVLNTQVLAAHEATWDRVLVSIEDATERMESQRALRRSEGHARILFEHSPVSLWVEDYSAVKRLLDQLRASGVVDLRHHLRADPSFVRRCVQAIRVIDVNRRTLEMFGAADRQILLDNLQLVLGDDMQTAFAEHFVELWEGRTFQQREVANRTLCGDRIDVYLQFAVQPGHEHDWERVLVSLMDITARKRAEVDLEFLITHDSLSGLRSRSFFTAELQRLERAGPWPVTLLVVDLNGLKPVNDRDGHAAGDALIRRAGRVLEAAVGARAQVARIGGDEFGVLLPATDALTADALSRVVRDQVEVDNLLHDGAGLSFSIGSATLAVGESAEAALHLADQRMYADKRAYYHSRGIDRRGDLPPAVDAVASAA